MNTRVQKWGNSLALRIPKALAREARLSQGSRVDLRLVDGRLVAEPGQMPEYRLDDLLAGVTDENIHQEISTGPPAGTEILCEVVAKAQTLLTP